MIFSSRESLMGLIPSVVLFIYLFWGYFVTHLATLQTSYSAARRLPSIHQVTGIRANQEHQLSCTTQLQAEAGFNPRLRLTHRPTRPSAVTIGDWLLCLLLCEHSRTTLGFYTIQAPFGSTVYTAVVIFYYLLFSLLPSCNRHTDFASCLFTKRH